MKKVSLLLAIILGLSLLTACGNTEKVYTAEDVAGKTYTYEKDGCGGPFTISIYADGTFQYYEGMLSSYIGMGTWTLDENNVLCIKDQKMGRFNEDGTIDMYIRTNYFKVEQDQLVWLAENSDNFLYVKAEDGDRFYGEPLPTLPELEELREAILGQNMSAVENEVLERLRGFTCEDTVKAWGDPDSMCSGLWCNFWDLDETTYIGVYYDADGYISEVRLGLKE